MKHFHFSLNNIDLLILSMSMVPGLAALSQSKPKTEQEIRSMLCHKWQIKSEVINGKETPVPVEMQTYFVFKTSGTLVQIDNGDSGDPVPWSCDFKNMNLKCDLGGGVETDKIVKITSTDLIIKLKPGEIEQIALKRVN